MRATDSGTPRPSASASPEASAPPRARTVSEPAYVAVAVAVAPSLPLTPLAIGTYAPSVARLNERISRATSAVQARLGGGAVSVAVPLASSWL